MLQRLLSPQSGIKLFAVWSGVLTLLALAKLLILTQSVELTTNAYGNQAVVWLLVGLNMCFGAGFAVSAYGLWMHYGWGRKLFLWTVGIWAGLNMMTVFVPGAYLQSSLGLQLLNGFRYAVALFVPVFYLNRTQIKVAFQPDSQESMVKDSANE